MIKKPTPTQPATKPKVLTKKKRILFTTITLLFGLTLALIAAELILRYLQNHIQSTDRLDPGLMLHDRQLGWRMKPQWVGQHGHYDFDVHYAINQYGFRGDFAERNAGQSGRVTAMVGDSFTFGLGVDDHETFVHRLNTRSDAVHSYLNFAVPGYSTDQELLLVEQRVFSFASDVILLVVYLGNDLFDNELAFPLQANNAKPYFELVGDRLSLRNTPVPLQTKPAHQTGQDLSQMVLGGIELDRGVIGGMLQKSAFFRLWRSSLVDYPVLSEHFETRFDYPLRLFSALINRLKSRCDQQKVELRLVLMPGRSFVENPGSPSQQYQDFLRSKILLLGKRIEVDVVDLAGYLKSHYEEHKERLFYPNEGHLTPQGHERVAQFLEGVLSN
ncbi:MAG: hypothetical protein GY807_06400 [Gammaproteobacteria bacterium]|nr:hypothetical protein [Gammaproteobacteria bacterium]